MPRGIPRETYTENEERHRYNAHLYWRFERGKDRPKHIPKEFRDKLRKELVDARMRALNCHVEN